MKVVLDIQDNKVDYILNWLKQFNFVKISIGKNAKAKAEAEELKNKAARQNKMQEMLLNGPVMTDAQYHDFLEKRKQSSSWK